MRTTEQSWRVRILRVRGGSSNHFLVVDAVAVYSPRTRR